MGCKIRTPIDSSYFLTEGVILFKYVLIIIIIIITKKPGVPRNYEFGLPEKRQFFQRIYMFKFLKTKMWVFSNDFFANVSFC